MSETAITNSNGLQAAQKGTGAVVILCLIIVLSVLLYGAVDTGTLALLALLSFGLVGYWTWTAMSTGELPVNLNVVQLPIIALGLVGLIQLLPFGGSSTPAGVLDLKAAASISLDPYATRFFLMRLFLFVVFFAAALTFVNSISRLRIVVVTLIAFGGLLAFYSILQRVEDPSSIYGLRQPAQAIPFGTFINRHHFAALMEMTLGLSLGVLFAGDIKRNRWPFIGAAAFVMAIAIVLTGSRGGVIGLITSLIAIAVFTAYGRSGLSDRTGISGFSPKLILIAGAIFLVVTLGIVLFLGGADPLLRGTGIGPGTGDFTSGRVDFWRTAVKIFLTHPILGVGLDAFGVAYSSYDASSGMFRVEQAHNDYLQTLADAGVIGFACISAFVFLLIKKGTEVIRQTSTSFRRGAAVGALAGCTAILVHSFFDFPLRTPANAFVFLTLAAVAIVRLPEEMSRHRRRARSSTDTGVSEQ
jgi:O-antigen ligase